MLQHVSVVLCCYNSAGRLTNTLARLAAQQVDSSINWEVIVVDNASTDNTTEVAHKSWSEGTSVPLRVVHEAQPGLSNARRKGVGEAQYELVCFVDDDNWLYPDYVQTVAEIMSRDPRIGALGSFSEAVFEVDPPFWFEQHKASYAVGAQTEKDGDVTWTRGTVWGAGMTIRKSAWHQLYNQGFQSLLADRTGTDLSSGGDSELCRALRLAGWLIWYDSRLRLQHFLPAGRLTWTYLRRLRRAFGAASVPRDAYDANTPGVRDKFSPPMQWNLRTKWIVQVVLVLGTMLRLVRYLPDYYSDSSEGCAGVLLLEKCVGRLTELLKRRSDYDRAIRAVSHANWLA